MGMSNRQTDLLDLQETALQELNERPESRSQCINEIRQWILEQEDLNGIIDDVFILKFLRNCKFDLQHTKDKIKRYYVMRNRAPEMFRNRDGRLEELHELLKLGMFVPMGYDSKGRRVVIAQLGACDPNTTSIYDVVKLKLMVVEAILRDAQTQIYGVVVVADMKGVNLGHIRLITISLLKKVIECWHKVIPIRLKGVYFFNSPLLFNALFRLISALAPEKLRNRFKLLGSNVDTLHQCIQPSCLPQEYGGSAGSLSEYTSLIETEILELSDWFLDDEKYGLLDSATTQ